MRRAFGNSTLIGWHTSVCIFSPGLTLFGAFTIRYGLQVCLYITKVKQKKLSFLTPKFVSTSNLFALTTARSFTCPSVSCKSFSMFALTEPWCNLQKLRQ